MKEVLEAGSGLKAGKDFHLAFSPEREDPANPDSKVGEVPKLVGGLTPACLERAMQVYGQAIKSLVPVSSCRVAEAAKLLENIFRSVNIALVNELKLIYAAMGIDIWEVVEAAKTKPFGFMAFYPGPGLGGHCIPIDPFYLTWKAREFERNTRFIELAGEINTAMPNHVVERIAEALNSVRKPLNGSRMLVLGLAYKPNVDDERESPSYRIMELLRQRGAEVAYHDPHVPIIRPTREHPQWAGTKSVDLGSSNDCGIRCGRHRHCARQCKLSGTGGLGALHRGHSKRDGEGASVARQGLESLIGGHVNSAQSEDPLCLGGLKDCVWSNAGRFGFRLG